MSKKHTVYVGCCSWLRIQVFCVVFCLCTLLVGRGRMRSHPSPANSHQSGPMLEPLREEAIAHSTGEHSPSTQGGHGHLTHQGPVYFSLLSHAVVYVCICNSACFCHCMCTYLYVNAHTVINSSLWWLYHTTAAGKKFNSLPGVRPHTYTVGRYIFHTPVSPPPLSTLIHHIIPRAPTPRHSALLAWL